MILTTVQRLFKILVLVILSGSLSAQTQPATEVNTIEVVEDYEATTLRLYYEQKWDSLLIKGKEAISKGFDYFYIQVRTGTAAYYLEKYSLAARFFDEAYKLDHNDAYTKEMLFLIYIYTGRQTQAALFTREMTPDRAKIFYDEYINPVVFMEGGPIITTGKKSAEQFNVNDSINFTEKFAEKNALYLITGLRQPLGPRVSVTTAVSYLNFAKYRQDEIRYVDSLSGEFKVRQAECYLSPTIGINKRFAFAPSGRVTRTSVTEPITSSDSITNLYLGNPIEKTFSDYLVGGEATYARNYWRLSAGAWYISVSQKTSWQLSSSVMLLPLGNLNLYSLTSILWNNERTESPLVYSQTVGSKLVNNTWLEVSGVLGNLAGTTEYNGQLLNNQINKSNYRLTALLIRDISPKLRLSLRYQYMQSESTVYYLDQNYELHDNGYKYNRHIITGGITWTVL